MSTCDNNTNNTTKDDDGVAVDTAAVGVKRNADTAQLQNDEEDVTSPKNTIGNDTNSNKPITEDGERPQKRFYRQRAHCNPLSHNDTFEYPNDPEQMNWKNDDNLYPNNTPPTVLDIGCGFGGLTLGLSVLLPNEIILGMEIRAKVTEYVRLRILAARKDGYHVVDNEPEKKKKKKQQQKADDNNEQHQQQPSGDGRHSHHYNNCAVMRTNSMKFLSNYFYKASLNKIFFCFPDPHFKRKNHPRRIINVRLLSEYAYVLKDYGKLYCITDVHELHIWHINHLEQHALFRKVITSDDDDVIKKKLYNDDPCIHAMQTLTEESHKVDRNKGNKYYAVYERIPNSKAEIVNATNFFR